MKQKLENDFKDIFRRIKKRDFSGNTGMAVKNSIYQFSTNFLAKIGALFFTVVIARLLLPELFGLYSLALSTILIFVTFSDLGIGDALVRFVSKSLGQNKNIKAKYYTVYLAKLKLFFVLISGLILILSARFISDTYYQKPLFLALIAGSFYILSVGAVAFTQSILLASNYFKGIFRKEIIFQITRFILIPLVILFSLKQIHSQEISLSLIILGLAFAYFIVFLFLLIWSKSKISFLKAKPKKIPVSEKNKLNKFMVAVSATAISGIFFGYIDMIMLGRFVAAEFLAYYKVPLSLIAASIPLISFALVLLPIFSRMKGKKLDNAFRKSIRITSTISVIAFLFVILFAYPFIRILYGVEYLPSVNILRFFSLLLFVYPISSIYNSYFIAKGKPIVITKILIISTVINIALNYILIKSLIGYGEIFAVFGVSAATLISGALYLGGLVLAKKKGN